MKIKKAWVSWEELNALGVAGGGAYYTKAEFDAFFEGEDAGKKQVHWDRITNPPATYAPSAHALVGAKHTASGLTIGHVVRATGATAFAWAQLQHSDLGGVTSDLHHPQAHTLASHSTKAHSELTGVTSDLHHAQIHASAHEVGGGDLVHHDDLTGFEASEHLSLPNTMANVLSSYLLNDLSDMVISVPENGEILQYFSATSDWRNVSEPPPAAHASTHHSGGSDQVNHDSLLGFVAAEHLSLPNTIANVLTNHTKAVHDSLDIDARYIDGIEVVAVAPSNNEVLTYVLANTRWEAKPFSPSIALNDLSDVVISAEENGEILQYFSATSDWRNVSEPWLGFGIPSGLIAIFDANCPSGWTRVSAFDEKFLRGSASYGGTGGAVSHYHSVNPPPTTSGTGAGDSVDEGTLAGYPVSPPTHTHSVDIAPFNSDSEDNLPPYINVVFCKKD